VGTAARRRLAPRVVTRCRPTRRADWC
jgi:hypothetical protein